MTIAFTAGFILGLSLILAIGAQNAFVLRQGLRKSHVFAVSLTCALSDAILIAAGVLGFGWIVETAPATIPILTWGGILFLLGYGVVSFYRAFTQTEGLYAEGANAGSLFSAVMTCLALTWLNPHVYLDTVVLLGSVSTRYEGAQFAFGLGAVVASFVFFFSLGYGARLLAPFFARPFAWRVLDMLVGIVMWTLALKLILT